MTLDAALTELEACGFVTKTARQGDLLFVAAGARHGVGESKTEFVYENPYFILEDSGRYVVCWQAESIGGVQQLCESLEEVVAFLRARGPLKER